MSDREEIPPMPSPDQAAPVDQAAPDPGVPVDQAAAETPAPETAAKLRRIRELEAELVADRRIAELEAELAQVRASVAAKEADKPPKNTHVLMLANGESVITSAPVATHHYSERDEATIPVVSVFELGEEG